MGQDTKNQKEICSHTQFSLLYCFLDRVKEKEQTNTTLQILIRPRCVWSHRPPYLVYPLRPDAEPHLHIFFTLAWIPQWLPWNSRSAGEGQETVPGHPHHQVSTHTNRSDESEREFLIDLIHMGTCKISIIKQIRAWKINTCYVIDTQPKCMWLFLSIKVWDALQHLVWRLQKSHRHG